MEGMDLLINTKSLEGTIEYGYYYLPSEICNNIIISAGVSGAQTSYAVKKIRKMLIRKRESIGRIIPALLNLNQDIITYYSGELAESIVYAAKSKKVVEIAIGYPKILVISVN
ncbi:MAG: hypothetical protein GX321_05465 [Clostridiales bacterium]|nr:hypothetical protein [Clostridiales bacterium]